MTIIRDADGAILPCCWDDCERSGQEEFKAITRSIDEVIANGRPARVVRKVNYVFCSERHKAFWVASPHMNGNLPTGQKGLIT